MTEIDENSTLLQLKKTGLERWLNHRLRIELVDGRVIVGRFVCTDNAPNIVLSEGEEFWKEREELRSEKTVLIELDDDVERREMKTLSSDQLRIAMLKKGVNPYKEVSPRDWKEQQITFQSFMSNLDQFVPTEAKAPFTNFSEKKNELKELLKHKFHNFWHGTRRIKKKVGFEKFNKKDFATAAEAIYVSAHEALIKRNKTALHKYVTESAFMKLWPDVERGNVVWELIRFNSPSQVVSIRCADNPSKSGNDIAQIIVRMHFTQKLAIYDRFGQLLLGSTEEPKECVEYVVFENHIASVDGAWRIHDKIYPHWMKPKQGPNSSAFQAAIENVPKPQKLTLGFGKPEKDDKKAEAQK